MGIDERYARVDSTGTEYFLTDQLGSTVGLTSANGDLTTRYRYEAYGEATQETLQGSPSTNPFQYVGRENDGVLYYYRARYYSFRMKRFTQEDPLGFVDGPNPNIYVQGNPISRWDPTGTTQCDIDFALRFAKANVTDQTVPGPDIVRVSHIDPQMPGFDGLGYTEHGYDGTGVPLRDFKVTLSDEFLRPLDRMQLEDLLETILHEGLHIDQPESIWSKSGRTREQLEYHEALRNRAFNKVVPLRDKFRVEREKCHCE